MKTRNQGLTTRRPDIGDVCVRPLLTIITPAFNAKEKLRRTIESVKVQKSAYYEHIIIDGGSTDGTQEYLAALHDPKISFVCEADAGPYDAMNKGIALSRGDLLNVLNAGDVYHDASVINDVIAAYIETDAKAIYGKAILEDVSANKKGKHQYFVSGKPKLVNFTSAEIIHQALFYERKLHDDVGKYDLSCGLAAEYDFMMKLQQTLRLKYQFVDKVLINYEGGGLSSHPLAFVDYKSVKMRYSAPSLMEQKTYQILRAIKEKYYLRPIKFFLTQLLFLRRRLKSAFLSRSCAGT